MDRGQAAQYQSVSAHGGAIYSGTIIVVQSTLPHGRSGSHNDETIPASPATADSSPRQHRPHPSGIACYMPAHPHHTAALAGKHGLEPVLTMWHQRKGEIITLVLYIQPGARHNKVMGLHGNALKVRLAAPPVEGRANEALLQFISGKFNVSLRNVELKHGTQSRHKIVLVRDSIVEPESLLDPETIPIR